MQSYKLHVVSEHLQDRYPYLELPFNDRMDKTEVYEAVFDRAIPKLVEILLMPDIEHYKYRDAFITLNEQVSHQENKDMMISQGLVGIASAYLQHSVVEIRREAVLLLGSLCSIMRGREFLDEVSFEGFQLLIKDEYLKAKEACAWCLCRILTGRDGVEILAKSKIVKFMIESFMEYTEKSKPDEAPYIIMLLEGFINVLQYDNGIEFFVGTGIIERLNKILKNEGDKLFDKQWCQRINYLSLDCLSKIIVNHQGKEESINVKVIETASQFLNSPELKEIQYSVILIMNATIHLEGKKQCTYVKDDQIIIKLIDLLSNEEIEPFTLKDVQQTLKNIAELPDGFLSITKNLAHDIEKLNEVFGPQVIIALANLLPKTSSLLNPPILDESKVAKYKLYCLSICGFILREEDDEALLKAIEDIVKIVEKLVVFMVYNSPEDEELFHKTAYTLIKICSQDATSLESLQRYLREYGDVVHPVTGTTLNHEITQYKNKKLIDLIQERI